VKPVQLSELVRELAEAVDKRRSGKLQLENETALTG